MRKFITIGLVISALILGLIASAAPNSNFTWTEPTNYENGTVIDATTDLITYNLYCGTTTGGPYTFVTEFLGGNSAANVDVGSCINGTPGTYYFVLTSNSTLYNTESVFSNELVVTYTTQDLGLVPNAPVLLSIQTSP